MFAQQLLVYAGPVVKTPDPCFRDESYKVLVSGFVLCEQDQVVSGTVFNGGFVFKRLVRATYISQPIIGLIPAAVAAS